ncbi:hypothetical protein PC9H_005172 [Pleurotus ostreatus]|uniref:Dol-P-Man:Man(5)GlcNAc(2)-PP-Dol alpha-1,3-mannosyltransferase n=2 Tax=Pleurotus ostreatus TaxID=5322 RepID=A0A067NMJ8_PLEO1|nr:uncharacterized protein PC9H_005172 [Pleurotus ostreatus]KAF7433222.1 hypothetical protein PC9H_005172 [Pleurotus ostreatus]KDQ29174.1 hypothetical protein PLEOSDRAFT_1092853 [Pleurotus ostreatus PC15]
MSVVKHLPSTLKQLLALRNPGTPPSQSLPRLHELFKRTMRDAASRNAETGWLVLTTCSLLTANQPSAVGHLYRFITRSDPNNPSTRGDIREAVNKAALMRESALKSVIFVGVPRVILTLSALSEALDDDVRNSLRTQSIRTATPENVDATVRRGKALWDNIYAPHADKLHAKLGSYHPDFISFIIQSYGSILAPFPGKTKAYKDTSDVDDPDQGNLSRAQGSVVGVACLRAEGGVGPQLTSHVFGLLKARNVDGLNREDLWLASDEGTEWVVRTVDEILDVVSSDVMAAASKVKL